MTDDWKTIFADSRYYGFDECLQRWDGKAIPVSQRKAEALSIYDLAHSSSEVRTFYDDAVIEWPEDIISLKWSNGTWTDLRTGKEFLYLHLLLMKNSWRFYQPKISFSKEVYVTGLGVSNFNQKIIFSMESFFWRISRAFACLSGVIRSLRRRYS
jgi:hypothetical protein